MHAFRLTRRWLLGLIGVATLPPAAAADDRMRRRRCPSQDCDFIHDPAIGDPKGGIPPGVAFEDLPDDWVCPVCGRSKAGW